MSSDEAVVRSDQGPRALALVIGASGLVGSHLTAALADGRHRFVGTYCRSSVEPFFVALDITHPAAVMSVVQEMRPTWVYLPAAQANVDQCEVDPDGAFATNVVGTRNVCEAASSVGSHVVFFSTDYVFDGDAGPYRETDDTNPVNHYGEQKLIAEQFVVDLGGLVIRTSTVYGRKRDGRLSFEDLPEQWSAGRVVKLAHDQICTPTYARDLARAAIRLAETERSGVLHVAGPTAIDRATFARHAALCFGFDPALVKGVSRLQLQQIARRPARGGLVSETVRALGDFELRDPPSGLEVLATSAATKRPVGPATARLPRQNC